MTSTRPGLHDPACPLLLPTLVSVLRGLPPACGGLAKRSRAACRRRSAQTRSKRPSLPPEAVAASKSSHAFIPTSGPQTGQTCKGSRQHEPESRPSGTNKRNNVNGRIRHSPPPSPNKRAKSKPPPLAASHQQRAAAFLFGCASDSLASGQPAAHVPRGGRQACRDVAVFRVSTVAASMQQRRRSSDLRVTASGPRPRAPRQHRRAQSLRVKACLRAALARKPRSGAAALCRCQSPTSPRDGQQRPDSPLASAGPWRLVARAGVECSGFPAASLGWRKPVAKGRRGHFDTYRGRAPSIGHGEEGTARR